MHEGCLLGFSFLLWYGKTECGGLAVWRVGFLKQLKSYFLSVTERKQAKKEATGQAVVVLVFILSP